MTTQDLKNNRNEIIATITELAGAENVKAVMEQMVKGFDCCDTMEELIESAIYMALQFEVKVEKSNLAKMMANDHQYERYNAQKKEWEKI